MGIFHPKYVIFIYAVKYAEAENCPLCSSLQDWGGVTSKELFYTCQLTILHPKLQSSVFFQTFPQLLKHYTFSGVTGTLIGIHIDTNPLAT